MILSPDRYQAERVCACLQNAGYLVSSVGLAEGDLADLCAQSPDLLLLEWVLPDLSALELIRRIRQDTCLAHVPVVLMGVEMREEDVLQALDAGADQCWREAFNPRGLVARVRAYLRRGEPNNPIAAS